MPCKDCKHSLAQVAVLIQAAEGARHPDGMANEGDIEFWYERLNHALATTPAQAHALLDRLQRAEAVVEALRQIKIIADDSAWGEKLWSEYLSEIRARARKALAAWEERTG